MRPKKTTDSDLLNAVYRCLVRHGITASSQLIANEVGVSQATLFKRFGTKEGLIKRALVSPIIGHPIFLRLQKLPTKGSPVQQIEELSLILLRFFEEMVPCIMLLRSGGFDLPSIEEVMETKNTPPIMMRILLTNWVAELQKIHELRSIPAESIALALLGAIQHRAMRTHILHDTTMTKSDEEYLASIVEIFWNGISKGESK